MIISTSKSDIMLKRAFDKGKTSIISIDRMLEQFSLDPAVAEPVRECYIVTNEDISAARLKTKFEQAAAAKHPNTKIIFINKSSKPIYPQGLPGVDAILQKPKSQDITQAVSAVIASSVVQDAIDYGSAENSIPQYTVPTPEPAPTPMGGFDEGMLGGDEPPEAPPLPMPPRPEPEPEPAPAPQDSESALVGRIKNAGSVSDVSVLMREIEASQLIKDLVESNSTYAGIEEKLKSLNDTIFTIMNDTSIKSLDEKLSKVRAILHDKAFFSSKGNTLIEQRLEEVIDAICAQTSALLQSRLDEIDTAIRKIQTQRDFDATHARLSGLNEEKANLITELMTLQVEIEDIFRASDKLTIGTATAIATDAENPTGHEMIDMHLRARGTQVIEDDTHTAIRTALELSVNEIPSTAKELKRKVVVMRKMLSDMFDMDAEIIAAQQAQINFLKAQIGRASCRERV
mgnify:CR=1 FL=1